MTSGTNPPAPEVSSHRSSTQSMRRWIGTHANEYQPLKAWQLNQVLGHGSFTTVYAACPFGCPPNRPSDYAIKLLRREFQSHPPALAAMRREAEVSRYGSHPNLLPILGAHVDDDPPHIVMPKIDGATLASVIDQVGGIIVPQALWLTRQVAQALRHLHRHGWVHSDVKPGNIMVSRQGHATLIDLGFAMRFDESLYGAQRDSLSATLSYAAPELLTSTTSTTPASDLYSLGVTLYEMISGQLPFVADDAPGLVEAQLRQPPPPFGANLDIPHDVERLVRHLLAKSPVRRPQSAGELIDALMELEIETLADGRFQETAA